VFFSKLTDLTRIHSVSSSIIVPGSKKSICLMFFLKKVIKNFVGSVLDRNRWII
jgi:hypothetical protein